MAFPHHSDEDIAPLAHTSLQHKHKGSNLSSTPLEPIRRRPRRLRASAALREILAETSLEPRHFIMPFFVVAGKQQRQPIPSLPGVYRYSPDMLMQELETCLQHGIRAVMLFGVVAAEHKDSQGSYAQHHEGPVPQALRAARRQFGDAIVLMSDVCLCGYTDHGHCGIVRQPSTGRAYVDNDATLPYLSAMAQCHAHAGADVVAPSDMMDGRVAHMRHTLDKGGFAHVAILAYSVKYASAFYGPFRDAAQSSPKDVGITGRHSYQMDYRNRREARLETALDSAEAADMLLVKPAISYLDILHQMRQDTSLPIVAYNVSGEYAMIKAASQAGALDERQAVQESLVAMRRAGADLIISYHALAALQAGWL